MSNNPNRRNNRVNGAGKPTPAQPAQPPKRVKRKLTKRTEELACQIMGLRTALSKLRHEKAELETRLAKQQIEIAELKHQVMLFETAQEDSNNVALIKEFKLPENFSYNTDPDGSVFVEHDAVEGSAGE